MEVHDLPLAFSENFVRKCPAFGHDEGGLIKLALMNRLALMNKLKTRRKFAPTLTGSTGQSPGQPARIRPFCKSTTAETAM